MRVLILGKGRVAKAINYYLKKNKAISKIAFFSNEKQVKNFDILIGALAGEIGEESLKLALKYKKNLIDLTDLEPEFYLKKKKEIEKRGIIVIPGCGFCPGLVNLILGYELSKQKNVKEIEVKAGTLSSKKFFFPFLWCFEDLILEHRIPSWQIISGKKVKFPPFAGYQKEIFSGIEAETYFAESELEYFAKNYEIKNFKFRIIRPFGFFWFFQYLNNCGFLEKENLSKTKKILESKKEDNLTLAEIKILAAERKIIWQIKSFSKKGERLNSIQKITGLAPAIVTQFIFENKIRNKGILLMEDIAKDKNIFQKILGRFKKEGIEVTEVKPRHSLNLN